MMQARSGAAFASTLASVGFWCGITVGRIGLSFLTPKIGELRAACIYVACGVTVELLFWLVPNFVVSALMVAFLGVFVGPLFCIPVVAAVKLLPKRLHISAIGFGAAAGGSGEAL